jgi:hypothetical protein
VFGATQGKETIIMTHFGHAAVVLALLAGTSLVGTTSADAQYYGEYGARFVAQPLPLTQAQRTIIYRTIIPQGRGRQPIVREQIITEPVGPVVRERIVTEGVVDAYAYGDPYDRPRYPRRYVVEPDAYSANAYVVGARVPVATRLAPLPPALVAEVPTIRTYRYATFGGRVLLVDPDTGIIVADVTP